MKNLFFLLKALKYTIYGNKTLLFSQIDEICYSSNEAFRGAAFFCLTGSKADGHSFAHEAYKKGARIFFCERILDLPKDALQIIVKNSRYALALVSAEFFDHPEKKLIIIGITGTKGKSTVCEMISSILNQAGKKCAVIGTLGVKIGTETKETENSTPESYIIYKSLTEAVSKGSEYAVIEVSSQALSYYRTEGLHFAAAVFTNLSRDHIGSHEHPDFTHYKNAKKSLFLQADKAFINADDVFGKEFSDSCSCPVYTYGTINKADITANKLHRFRENGIFGVSFTCECHEKKLRVRLPLPGDFSVLNALAAISVCFSFGISLEICAEALRTVRIGGRFEIVPCSRRDITCIIDYAHNRQSLENALSALREYNPGRIICIFGSVGGRTRERRRELGEIASSLADICIVTSDNPDFEAPDEIIREIASYIPAEKCICIIDRSEAVEYALNIAKPGDFLLFAGKGHEQYQLINGKKLPFSERELIKNHIFKKDFIPFP